MTEIYKYGVKPAKIIKNARKIFSPKLEIKGAPLTLSVIISFAS